MNRRDLLRSTAALAGAASLPRAAFAQSSPLFDPRPEGWKSYEIVTRIELPAAGAGQAQGHAQAWIPVPAVNEAAWFRTLGSTWTTNGSAQGEVTDPVYGSRAVHVGWTGVAAPVLEVTSRVQTRDRAVDLTRPGDAAPLSAAERSLYLAATDLIPTGGIVKETADRIVAGKAGEIEKARAIYEWVVENSYRRASTRGCGIGDIATMLKTGDLGGKCADLNALFVGLARAAGLPARDVYGIRLAPSRFGYKSLGAGSEIVSKAQHCRAEVHLAGFGWVPADPADVRKVVLEEPPGALKLDDAKVTAARRALFGAWEGNWMAYNFAHDINLPGAAGPRLEFLMYPQAEVAGIRLDCLDPDSFRYTIRAREVSI